MRYLVIGNFRREDKSKWRMKWNNLMVNHNPLMQHLMLTVSDQDAELPKFGMMISLLKLFFFFLIEKLVVQTINAFPCRSCCDWVWHICSHKIHSGTMLAGTSFFPSKKKKNVCENIEDTQGFWLFLSFYIDK